MLLFYLRTFVKRIGIKQRKIDIELKFLVRTPFPFHYPVLAVYGAGQARHIYLSTPPLPRPPPPPPHHPLHLSPNICNKLGQLFLLESITHHMRSI